MSEPTSTKTFLVDYQFAGATYSFEIRAVSWRVAENMVAAIRSSAVVVGEDAVKFSTLTPIWLVRLLIWLKAEPKE